MDRLNQKDVLDVPLYDNPAEAENWQQNEALTESPAQQSLCQQMARFQEHLEEWAVEPAADEAAVGLISAQFMKMSFQMSLLIDARLEDAGPGNQELDRLMRSIDGLLRLARQAERYTHLRLQLANMRQSLKQLSNNESPSD